MDVRVTWKADVCVVCGWKGNKRAHHVDHSASLGLTIDAISRDTNKFNILYSRL